MGKFVTKEVLGEEKVLWVDALTMIPGVGGDRGKFDLVVLGHVLQELPNANQRQLIVETLWSRVREGGLMVYVEAGSPKGFRFLTSFRNWIIEKPRQEASIVAPCPHNGTCPLASKSRTWCHFS